LYGPGKSFETASSRSPFPVHVGAAAEAARLATVRGSPGVYNIAEDDEVVSSRKAIDILGWSPTFRIDPGTASA
jgi:hypothetical protein